MHDSFTGMSDDESRGQHSRAGRSSNVRNGQVKGTPISSRQPQPLKTSESARKDDAVGDADVKSENVSTHSRDVVLDKQTNQNRINFKNTITMRNKVALPMIHTNDSDLHGKVDNR